MGATRSVLIVGGGIAGLALGRALRVRGLEPCIVERMPTWSATGTGIYMPGNGVRALAALGLRLDGLSVVRMSHQRLLDHRGRSLAEIDLARVWGTVFPCLGMRRTDLHGLLVEGAAGVPTRLGTSVRSVTQNADRVTVGFEDGDTREYDVVVGADGIRSSIRRLVFGETSPRYVGQVSWRFLTTNDGGLTTWTAMLGPDRAWLMMPVGGGGLYCYADLVSRVLEDPTARDLTRFRALFEDFAAPVPRLLERLGSVDASHFAPIEEVMVDPCVKGRVVLIGDAAHATSPNMAEGASMALEDALILSEMLERDGHPVDLLAAFADRRRARVRWVQERTHRRDRIRSLPAWVRHVALRSAGAAIYRQDYRPLLDAP